MDNCLVYTTLGGSNVEYSKLTIHMLKSVKKYLPEVQIAIICNTQFAEYIRKECSNIKFLHFEILDTIISNDEAAANKLKIFDYDNIYKFKSIIYLDSDIILKGSNKIENIVNNIKINNIYLVKEGNFDNFHWNIQTYSNDKKLEFIKTNKYTFNTGQFIFSPCVKIKNLFELAYKSFMNDRHASLYEQGHFNDVFLNQDYVVLKYSLSEATLLHSLTHNNIWCNYNINHFCGSGYTLETKLIAMLNCLRS